MTLGAAGTNKCDWDKSTEVKVFQRQELTDLSSQRPRGGVFSHTYSWGRWEKALHHHELMKSPPNWFSIENEHQAVSFLSCFNPKCDQKLPMMLPANLLCKRLKMMLHCESWSYCWATAHSCVKTNISHVWVMFMVWISGFFQDFSGGVMLVKGGPRLHRTCCT